MSRTVRKIDPTRYKKLLSQTLPVVIETKEENERMLTVVEKLVEKGEQLSPEEEKLLKLFSRLIEDFEQRYYRPKVATPLEVVQHLMESADVKQSHLLEVFGSKGIAAEVLNGKRGISKAQAKGTGKLLPRPSRFVYLMPKHRPSLYNTTCWALRRIHYSGVACAPFFRVAADQAICYRTTATLQQGLFHSSRPRSFI